MRRIFPAMIILALLLSGCGAGEPAESVPPDTERPSVVAANFPAYDFARAVAGGLADVTMLLPPGAESHSFEPTAQDMIRIEACDVFIYTGGESDEWARRILDSVDTSGMTILAMMDMVDTVEEELKEGMEAEHDGHEGDEREAEYDEHVWTSPVNAEVISAGIRDALSELDESSVEGYRANFEVFAGELRALDAELRSVLAEAVRKTLVFGDRFPFRYLVDEYGLDYVAAFPGCSSETEADARTIAFLIDKVTAEDIPVVFYIEFSSGKIADAICEATGAEKLLLHSCHNVTKTEFESGITYLELMRANLENLRKAVS